MITLTAATLTGTALTAMNLGAAGTGLVGFAGAAIDVLWRASWQGAIVIAVVWAIARWYTFVSPRAVCWLWRLACVKLLLLVLAVPPIALALLPANILPVAMNMAAVPRATVVEGQPDAGEAIVPTVGLTLGLGPADALQGLLLAAWLGGVAVAVRRMTAELRAARQLAAASEEPAGDRLATICRAQARRLGIDVPPELRLSRELSSPALVGVARPIILFPFDAETRFDDGELGWMFAHELAHYRRHDLAWNWLLAAVRSVLFFHPLVWLLTRGWFEAQESACDEVVLAGASQPSGYARVLLKVCGQTAARWRPSLATAGISITFRNLERRIGAMSYLRPFTRRRLLATWTLALLFALVAVVPWRLVAEDKKSDPGVRTASTNNIKGIMLALLNHHDVNKSYPPAVLTSGGKPTLSWRVAILPFLDDASRKLYAEFHLDEPWDSAHNKPLVAKMPDVFQSPASALSDGRTVYLTARGPSTLFPGEKGIKIREVTDGTSKTIAVLEVDDERAVPWTKPDDWELDPKQPHAGLGGQLADGFLTAFADGSAHFLPNSIDDKTLNELLTRNGREPVNIPQ